MPALLEFFTFVKIFTISSGFPYLFSLFYTYIYLHLDMFVQLIKKVRSTNCKNVKVIANKT